MKEKLKKKYISDCTQPEAEINCNGAVTQLSSPKNTYFFSEYSERRTKLHFCLRGFFFLFCKYRPDCHRVYYWETVKGRWDLTSSTIRLKCPLVNASALKKKKNSQTCLWNLLFFWIIRSQLPHVHNKYKYLMERMSQKVFNRCSPDDKHAMLFFFLPYIL